MKQRAIFIEGQHDYNLVVKENEYLLYYSNGDQWNDSTKGEFIMGLKDTGNGYKMIKPLQKKGKIQYDEAVELYILLAEIKNFRIEIFEKTDEI